MFHFQISNAYMKELSNSSEKSQATPPLHEKPAGGPLRLYICHQTSAFALTNPQGKDNEVWKGVSSFQKLLKKV